MAKHIDAKKLIGALRMEVDAARMDYVNSHDCSDAYCDGCILKAEIFTQLINVIMFVCDIPAEEA